MYFRIPRSPFLSLRICLQVWKIMEGRDLEKKKEQMEEKNDIEKGMLWGFIFLSNTKSSSFEELKNCIGGGFYPKISRSKNVIDFTIFSYIFNPLKSSLPLPSKHPNKALGSILPFMIQSHKHLSWYQFNLTSLYSNH